MPSFLSSLVIGRKGQEERKRKRTLLSLGRHPQRILRSSVSKSSPRSSCLESWVPDLEFLWRSQNAGLAGSHVILICFHHSNSKLQQLAERRQAVNQESYITSIFCKHISLLSSYFLSSLHFHKRNAKVKATLLTALGSYEAYVWNSLVCIASSRLH